MRDKIWFIIRNVAGRIEILSGAFKMRNEAIDVSLVDFGGDCEIVETSEKFSFLQTIKQRN